MATQTTLSPLMRQYFAIKNQFPDALILFQVGDFYELFFADAQKAAAFLGIVLTQRGILGDEPIPLCGVPRHTCEHYIAKLVKGGFRVVVCDQLEVAQAGKLVERGVTHVFTPGTLIDSKLIENKSPHYLCAVIIVDGVIGLLFYEMLSGMVYVTHFDYSEKKLDAELLSFMPQEVLVAPGATGKQLEQICRQRALITTIVNDTLTPSDLEQWYASFDRLAGQGDSLELANRSVLALLGGYIKKHAPYSFATQKTLLRYQPDNFLQLDAATQKNLELIHNSYDGSATHTLFQVIDQAVTGMGSRLLKKWLLRPLVDEQLIEKRLDRVEFFVKNSFDRTLVRASLKKIGDIERTLGRMVLRKASIGDYTALKESLAEIPSLHSYGSFDMHLLTQAYTLLTRTLNSDTQVPYKIAVGYDGELDRLRQLATQGMQAIFELERKEQQKSGIGTLKIRYSQAAGYAIEIGKASAEQAPAYYVKMQSLTNRDRFTTQELKDLEYDIMRAESMSQELEHNFFATFVRDLEFFLPGLRTIAVMLAELDAFVALAHAATCYQWNRPSFTHHGTFTIQQGRHPIVEQRMHVADGTGAQSFVPNETTLEPGHRTWIITGPNMGGKSTYLRQNALIAILAQMGSFVPARKAVVPLFDRIFTRIGAGDHLAEGKSTFLVEMEETALICKEATNKSLVILDEVGRGTSTYDGLALAQAIVEYLHEVSRPLCLFATHYHELTDLARTLTGVACYHAASKPVGDSVMLLHKIMPGVAQGSFGIQVAIAAQLPEVVIQRARLLLSHFSSHGVSYPAPNGQVAGDYFRSDLSGPSDALQIKQQLDDLDMDNLSPRQAYDFLYKLKNP